MGEFVLLGLTFSVFWVALVVLFIISVIAEANENGFWATLGFIVFSAGVYYWDATNFQWLLNNLLTYGPIYLVIGAVFALIRFHFWGRSNGKKYLERKIEWMKKNKIKLIDDKSDSEFIEKFHAEDYHAADLIDPKQVKNHAFRWWFNWPGSLLWWVLSDLLKNIWDFVWDKVKNVFKKAFESGFNSTAKQ